jgi:hypothetical protein
MVRVVGSTPRKHRYQLPMATRSTDVSMMHQCPGRWVLSNLYESEQAEASFFILGTALHETIEVAINMDLDLDWALRHLNAHLEREFERLAESPAIKLQTSKRGFDTMFGDAERMLRNWFRTVHPDSAKRLPIYDEYEWPPKTEVAWMSVGTDTAYPQWGSIDAVFEAEDRFALVDWKSGTSRQRDSNQLQFYRYGFDPGAEAWFHHLDKVQARSVIQMADDYPGDDAVKQRILATEAIKDSIIEGQYPTFNPDWYCGYCPVQHVCPADGDFRNREDNAVNLRRMLRLARPLTEIERKAS